MFHGRLNIAAKLVPNQLAHRASSFYTPLSNPGFITTLGRSFTLSTPLVYAEWRACSWQVYLFSPHHYL